MNRNIFMKRLRECLSDIPAEEREEALAYYESYFEEAGTENEEDVIRELELPEKLAETIKKDLFGENGGNPMAPKVRAPFTEKEFRKESKKDKNEKVILLIVIAILSFPIWITALGIIFGIFTAIFGGLFGCAVAIIAGTGGLLVSGAVIIFAGIAGGGAAGVLMIGAGFLIAAIGMLLLVCTAWLCGKGIPVVCRGVVQLCRNLLQKRKERAL